MKVDNSIPIPKIRQGNKKYPWDEVKKKGDSFFVPLDGDKINNLHNSLNSCARAHFKATVRRVTENGIRGIRVWRIA